MKKKILITCQANVIRSPIAKQIFCAHGLDTYFDITTAGVHATSSQRFSDLAPYINEALRRNNYPIIDRHTPALLKSDTSISADIIFTLDRHVHGSLYNRWKDDSRSKKMHFLPEYASVPKSKDFQQIFDPMRMMIAPRTKISLSEPTRKNLAVALLNISRGNLMATFVYKTTGYLPAIYSSIFWEENVQLYERTIREINCCMDGTITRMKSEGLLPTN